MMRPKALVIGTEIDVGGRQTVGATMRARSGLHRSGLPDRIVRARLARMICNLFDHWQIDVRTQATLLGLSPRGDAIYRYRKGGALPNRRDLLERVGYLFGLHGSLRMIYPYNRELVYRWPTARNKMFNNLAPVEFMIDRGLPGMAAIRGYLEQLRHS